MSFSDPMIFTNLTRANEIGANSYLLDFEGDGRARARCRHASARRGQRRPAAARGNAVRFGRHDPGQPRASRPHRRAAAAHARASLRPRVHERADLLPRRSAAPQFGAGHAQAEGGKGHRGVSRSSPIASSTSSSASGRRADWSGLGRCAAIPTRWTSRSLSSSTMQGTSSARSARRCIIAGARSSTPAT